MTTLAFIGDVMLGRGVNEELRHISPDRVWGTTLPVLRTADAVIANLECAITRETSPWTRTSKRFHFRADPGAAEVLRAANVRCVSLANNHALDFQEAGLLETLAHLDAARIGHAGAGANRAQAAAAAMVCLPDLVVGVVGLTDNEPSFAAGTHTPGTNFVPIESAPPPGIGLVQLAACRHLGADLGVLSLHWGPNRTTRPTERFRDFAHAAIEAGFDMIHGHSAHLFQGVEIYRGRPIFYDCGDFIDDYAVDDELHNDWSFIFLADVANARIERVRLLPVRLGYARVDLATGSEAAAIRARMAERCRALGTEVVDADGELEIACDVAALAASAS